MAICIMGSLFLVLGLTFAYVISFSYLSGSETNLTNRKKLFGWFFNEKKVNQELESPDPKALPLASPSQSTEMSLDETGKIKGGKLSHIPQKTDPDPTEVALGKQISKTINIRASLGKLQASQENNP